MPNLLLSGIIATVFVTIIGVLYALPPYLDSIEASQKVPDVLLSLSVTSDENMPQWCTDVEELLNKHQLRAVVFFSGKVAETYPDCVKAFNKNVDIGSSTYSYTKLSMDRDYTQQLDDVGRGKSTVSAIADINSTSFKAPYGYTDDNIYSLLTRNGIVADFSRTGSYNKYNGNMFILYDLKTFDLGQSSVDEIESQITKKVSDQIQITADNSVSIEKIASLVTKVLDKHEGTFVNASDITTTRLTVRRE